MQFKNTDATYCSTFGFAPAEREEGIIEIESIRRLLSSRAGVIPIDQLVGYLEIGGPKLGRDYSDRELADQLRASLDYLKTAWCTDGLPEEPKGRPTRAEAASARQAPPAVKVFPSVMCVDFRHFEEGVQKLEAAGADVLHVDMADGHFVPNLLLGVDVVRALVETTSLPVDVHLMVENPDD